MNLNELLDSILANRVFHLTQIKAASEAVRTLHSVGDKVALRALAGILLGEKWPLGLSQESAVDAYQSLSRQERNWYKSLIYSFAFAVVAKAPESPVERPECKNDHSTAIHDGLCMICLGVKHHLC